MEEHVSPVGRRGRASGCWWARQEAEVEFDRDDFHVGADDRHGRGYSLVARERCLMFRGITDDSMSG